MKNKICFISIILALFLFNFSLFAAQDEGALRQSISVPNIQNKISLDIKGMDIIDVLKIISARAGINIIVGKNVTGRVTLFLKDVDVNDAFEIVILANDLAYDKKGGIVNIMTSRDYELIYGERFLDKKQLLNVQLKYAKAQTLSQVLSQIKSNIGRVVIDEPTNTLIIMDIPERLSEMNKMIISLDRPLDTRVFNLNYAQADKINAKIQEAITKGIGSVKIDERTNKIAITDYPEKVDDIAKVISAFDEKTQQVLIDAQIVEISPRKDEFSMGVDWDYWLRKNVRLISALPAPALSSVSSIPAKLAFGIASADTDGSVSGQGQYKSIVDALRVIGETKILSSPRIMVLNNQEAKILVGTKDAYITSTTSQSGSGSTITSQSVNFVDVGIKLFVTPTINRDGFVTIKVRPEISSSTRTDIKSEGQVTQIPIVTTSETETTIMIKDGTTIIIAGLKKDKHEKEIRKVPLIGDIPFLGAFFRNIKEETTKTELVIFITPHIVSGEEPLEYVSLSQDKDITRLQSLAEEKHRNLTNGNLSNFENYKQLVFNKIKSEFAILKKTEKNLRGESSLSFILSRDGRLKGEPYILSSNNNVLNTVAIKSIKKASPFPPLPESIEKYEETFKLNLSYK